MCNISFIGGYQAVHNVNSSQKGNHSDGLNNKTLEVTAGCGPCTDVWLPRGVIKLHNTS